MKKKIIFGVCSFILVLGCVLAIVLKPASKNMGDVLDDDHIEENINAEENQEEINENENILDNEKIDEDKKEEQDSNNDTHNKPSETKPNETENNNNNTENNEKEPNDVEINWDDIDLLLENMTIEEKISQMLIISYSGSNVDNNLLNRIKTKGLGGVILFKDNITTLDATKRFVASLQDASKVPLFVSIDEEGGSVQRLRALKDIKPTYIPFMAELGKTKDTLLSYQVGRLMAEELKTIGVNVDFAPVVDILSNPNSSIGLRSFGSDATLVTNMALSLAKGLEDEGIIATYKHFPGHGDVVTDSHNGLPIITKNYEELKELELIPFQEAINNNAKMIMVGHLALPKITGNETPASLSKKVITDILKEDMGYSGLVITDALNMDALKDYKEEDIYVKAVEAGVDILLMPKNIEIAITAIKNNIDEKRIDESVRKILTLKKEYVKPNNFADQKVLGSKEHQDIINIINNSNK